MSQRPEAMNCPNYPQSDDDFWIDDEDDGIPMCVNCIPPNNRDIEDELGRDWQQRMACIDDIIGGLNDKNSDTSKNI